MKFGFAAAASLMVLSAGAAFAQDEVDYGSVYARLGAGVSFVSDWEQDYAFSPAPTSSLNCAPADPCAAVVLGPPSGQTVFLGNDWTAAAALGFDYADGIRTELEYRYAKTGVESAAVDYAEPLPQLSAGDDDIVAQFLMANFFFDFNNSTAVTPFIGGGVGGAFVSSRRDETDAALALQGRAGLSFEAGDELNFDLEYIYLRTNELDFGPRAETFPAGDFEISTSGERYRASSVMVSIRKAF
ncbi:outer membrane protein [Hyphococcus luteus]|uniref:Outer membrane protein beta-barrel domain-containing protein n=1 Tax=Hyphococcus luteus TaxID=2058213 RepID=A0A2S7K686_9PROT|nr:outer membrane beta-barrel protein [Marinicaulis flavus]PQA88020.1 hypothetical protein CW354_06715 [Marinicaulis flavus]